MLEKLGLIEAGSFLIRLTLSFTFFVGIFLMVSREAVRCLNRDFQRELGWRKYIIPQLERKGFFFIDAFVLEHAVWVGAVITVASFILLLIHKT
ncbi:MAG: hypothetical protein AB1650_04305 [Candidatus Omnitrophota bacterium]